MVEKDFIYMTGLIYVGSPQLQYFLFLNNCISDSLFKDSHFGNIFRVSQ